MGARQAGVHGSFFAPVRALTTEWQQRRPAAAWFAPVEAEYLHPVNKSCGPLDVHLANVTGPGADAPVFVSPEGGPVRRATLSDAWQPAKAATGAPTELHIHDLRHHAATLTARMPGVTTKELMARIGHSSPVAALPARHRRTRPRHRELPR